MSSSKSVISLEGIRSKLSDLKSQSTAKAYYDRIFYMYNEFHKKEPLKTLRELFDNSKMVIDYIQRGGKHGNQLRSLSSKRGYLSAYLSLLVEFDFDSEKRKLVSSIIKDQIKESYVEQKQNIQVHDIDVAKDTFKKLEVMYQEYYSKMSKDNYDINRMWAAYLYLVLNYGVLRNAELSSILVSTGESQHDNYINKATGELIIREHKTKASNPERRYKLDSKFMSIIAPATHALMFSGKPQKNVSGGNFYNTPDGFKKRINRDLKIDNYELRKMKVSIELSKKNNMKAIEALSEFQGHSLQTQYDYYNTYKQSLSDTN